MKKTNKKITLATVTLLAGFTLATTSVTNMSQVFANEVVSSVPADKPGVTYTTTPEYKVAGTIKLDSSKPDSTTLEGYKKIEEVEYEDSNSVPSGYVKDDSKTDYYENLKEFSGSFAYKFFKPIGNTQSDTPVTPEKPSEDAQPEAPVTPEKPSEDVKPEASVTPEKPSEDVKPEAPTTSEKPSEDVKPEAPVTPEKPSEDVKPEAPATSEKPSKDVKPTTSNDTKVVNKDSKATLPNTGDASILSLIAGLSGLSLFGFKNRKNK